MASGRSKNYYEDISKSGPAESSTDVSKIVDEFHCLYNEKIVKLQMMNPGCTELKINALEEWVRDLTEQNRMLVKTVENLEKNALDRVDTLDSVLRKKSAENESRSCKDCPDLNQRCDKMKAELENAKHLLNEKECYMQNYIKQIEDMKKALCKQSAVTNQGTQKSIDSNCCELEQAMVDLKSQLCINEKVLQARTEEMECLKFKLAEMEQMNQMLQSEAEKGRCIPKLQEAIGLLRDAVKEKDCILEQYHQEINCLKNEMSQAEDQDSKIYELEDSLKYYEQCLKQKDLMLEKLKAHIKQLRQCLSQLQCQQDRGKISRSSSSEENYNLGELSGYNSFRNDDAVMAGGDSKLVEELRKKLVNEKDMQLALTAEVAEKHDALMRMKDHLKELEEQLRQSDMQTHFKDDIIRQLRKEVKLGRAKESLAEMLGLKGGPRAQMKAKIDHLHSELEEREIEISRLEGKLEASRLPMVEAKLTKLEMELVDRERSILVLCDKLDYVRRYLSKLRGSEEDISVKCGLEALLIELSEDVEWMRETRRNISIPLADDPNESIIIISHRSHSLPDTTLQKQVQSFKATSESAVFYDCENQENGEALNFKEQISNLECNLSDTLIQLNSMWETMKECELENGDSTYRLTKEVQSSIEKEHNQLLQINNEMQYITCQINELTSLGVNSDYLLHCIEKCLVESLNMLSKQKTLMGIPESSSGSVNDDSNFPPNFKYIKCIESILGDSVSLLQQLKRKLLSWDESTSKININKTNEINNTVNNLISNRQNVLDKLCLVNVSQDEISKKIFKKFSDFDNTFGIHQNVVKGLKYFLNHFVFNDFISKNSRQDILALPICEEANKVPLKDLKLSVDASSSDINLKKIRSLRKNRLSRSSPSIGEEYQSDVIGNVHMKTAHLQQIALALNKEIKSYLKEVLLREDKTREFVCESQDLNKTLSNLNKELCASEKVLFENKISLSVPSLQSTLRQAQTEVELLLCKVDDFTNYKDMYDMNRSKMEQEIQELQKSMFTVVSDIMDAIKVSQDYDNNLLNSYRTKIQSYREKVEQLEKHLTTSIDQNEMEEKDEEEDLICKLTDKIEKYQSEVEKLKNSINIVKKDKETVEMENQQVMEELQAKICTLQAALQNEAQQHHPIVRMHAYIKQQKEEYTNKLNQESDESALNKQEVNILNEMLKQNQIEIRRLKSQVFTLQSVKEQLESTIGINPSEQSNEFKLVKMENIRIKKELEQTIGLNFSHRKNNEELREKLKQVQDEAYALRARALKQKEQLTYLIEECKQFKIDKEKVENEKEDLVYEITNLKEELASVRGSECKIAAEMIKNSQKICQLVHEKENLEKLLEDKIELNKKLENVINELTKECEKLRNENFKIVQQNEVLQFMTNKMEALNEELSEKDKKVEALEHRLKSLMNPYQMEGQDLIKTHENGEDMENIIRKSVTLEESIDNLEAENVKLCNENMRLKNEIKLLCHVNNDSALSNVPEEEDDDNYKTVLVNKISSYRKKLKTFMQQNWRLIEMVNKLQHINNLLATNKENIKLRRLVSVNKENVNEKFYQTQHIGGDGEMQPYECY